MTKDGRNEPRVDADEILAGIKEWVDIESPSHDAAAVNRVVTKVEGQLRGVGARIERIPGRDGFGDVLIARTPWGGDGPGILVLAHLDTVHPIGSLATPDLRWRREGDSIYGPGIYDMKGGAHMAYYAFRHFVRQGRTTPLPITFMYIPEEEVGSPTSEAHITEHAKRSKYALVLEPARTGGGVVTARKGVARFVMNVHGRAAHAGARHEDGRSAIREAAKQILAIEAMTDYGRGITTNIGLVAGGTGVNVIPAECRCEIDLRVPNDAVGVEMCGRILGLASNDPDVKLLIEGGMNRPPYPKNDGIEKLYQHARGLAAEIGFDLWEAPQTGGGSDGNFTVAAGIPTLDGLGPDGKGPHTNYEQIFFSSLEQRTKLLIRLFETLT